MIKKKKVKKVKKTKAKKEINLKEFNEVLKSVFLLKH